MQKRDELKRQESYTNGMRHMFDPFERVAREYHKCPCCERAFTPDEEDQFIRKQRIQSAIQRKSAEVLAMESSNAETIFQQLDKLCIIYEDYVKLGEEAIPLAEKNLTLLLADESLIHLDLLC
ncbi:hypothetical protein ACP4OV_012646 [Aristida adscensionis]